MATFQSTLPARGATREDHHHRPQGCISIHAPRTGSDILTFVVHAQKSNISIHAPRTGSDKMANVMTRISLFQSTLPARGATCSPGAGTSGGKHFNPRSPHGERRSGKVKDYGAFQFQSTLPARGATLPVFFQLCVTAISIHAPRTGSDVTYPARFLSLCHFNPRSPHGERRGTKWRGI